MQFEKAILSHHQYKILCYVYKHKNLTLSELLYKFSTSQNDYQEFLYSVNGLVFLHKEKDFFNSKVALTEIGIISYEQTCEYIFDKYITRAMAALALIFSLISITMTFINWFC